MKTARKVVSLLIALTVLPRAAESPHTLTAAFGREQ